MTCSIVDDSKDQPKVFIILLECTPSRLWMHYNKTSIPTNVIHGIMDDICNNVIFGKTAVLVLGKKRLLTHSVER